MASIAQLLTEDRRRELTAVREDIRKRAQFSAAKKQNAAERSRVLKSGVRIIGGRA
jgi:hypothetical protein